MHYTIDQEIDEIFMTDCVRKAVLSLEARDAKVLTLWYGLDGREPMTFAQIGEVMGVSGIRIRQLRDRALRRLRESVHGCALESFVGRDCYN